MEYTDYYMPEVLIIMFNNTIGKYIVRTGDYEYYSYLFIVRSKTYKFITLDNYVQL